MHMALDQLAMENSESDLSVKLQKFLIHTSKLYIILMERHRSLFLKYCACQFHQYAWEHVLTFPHFVYSWTYRLV